MRVVGVTGRHLWRSYGERMTFLPSFFRRRRVPPVTCALDPARHLMREVMEAGPAEQVEVSMREGRVAAFTLRGPAGHEAFIVQGARAVGRGGSFDLSSPAGRGVLRSTVQAAVLTVDDYLELQSAAVVAGCSLVRGVDVLDGAERWTPLRAVHADGRVVWAAEVTRALTGMPLEQYVWAGGYRVGAYRHHEPLGIVRLMAQTDEALRAQGIVPERLPALLVTSAWLVRSGVVAALLEGATLDGDLTVPGDFEWQETAYQQLWLSLTRAEVRRAGVGGTATWVDLSAWRWRAG